MTAQDYAILGGMFVVVNGLIEIIKMMVSNWTKKNGKSGNPGNPISSDKLESIYQASIGVPELKQKLALALDILSQKDSDGIPRVYMPTSVVKLIEQEIKLQERTLDRIDTVIKLFSVPKDE